MSYTQLWLDGTCQVREEIAMGPATYVCTSAVPTGFLPVTWVYSFVEQGGGGTMVLNHVGVIPLEFEVGKIYTFTGVMT